MKMNAASKSSENRALFGLLAFWTAVAAAGSVAMIGITSFTAFNPPNWLRIATMAPLPFLLIGALGFGAAGYKRKSGRAWSIAGFMIAGLSVIAFIIMLTMGS